MALLPVRTFDGDDQIRCLPGSADITGAWSIAALMRVPVSGFYSVVQGHVSSTSARGYGLETNSGRSLGVYSTSGGEPFTGSNFLPASGWALIAVTKASGAEYPTFHCYDFDERTWRPPARGGARVNNPAAFGPSGGFLYFGTYQTSYRFRGQLAAIAMWNAVLTTETVRQLKSVAGLERWADVAAPKALWLFDQASAEISVRDRVGGAHEYDHVGTVAELVDDLPIPYRPSIAVYDDTGWNPQSLQTYDGANWTNATFVGVL
ncbi:hypothetical protein Q5424_09340 [Conexibacter sp. JD483]|uniref:hypothetical protein n=1 Tax=unclassified Conexibacter TaxID=2627773 RepID=UPI002721AEFB|nr:MULTISPECIES: hypothetical protein [unclassified Conexibacter]MDO8187220.1 hypothetical protein [Conexibacter sp. CPCC 205706]MDO8199317.1 hypothetical protein [Conexibacter sp. CPCC 205762]MDR9369282.1 hypothetical protein [Conexibacter sp. JD483]